MNDLFDNLKDLKTQIKKDEEKKKEDDKKGKEKKLQNEFALYLKDANIKKLK
ncbi:MAG: hypothetical protein ACK5LP_06015 [Campylobacteraceae bacterium]